MNKAIIITIAALVALSAILAACLIAAIKDKKKLKAEIKRLEEMFVFAGKEREIHEEERKKAEGKIGDLHIGNSVANAMAELQKRRGSPAAR
ncbi:MAG: hypothetical protein J6Y60_12555 [Treponema sp.]|nr:hypothetical protein [Treponema sp.]